MSNICCENNCCNLSNNHTNFAKNLEKNNTSQKWQFKKCVCFEIFNLSSGWRNVTSLYKCAYYILNVTLPWRHHLSCFKVANYNFVLLQSKSKMFIKLFNLLMEREKCTVNVIFRYACYFFHIFTEQSIKIIQKGNCYCLFILTHCEYIPGNNLKNANLWNLDGNLTRSCCPETHALAQLLIHLRYLITHQMRCIIIGLELTWNSLDIYLYHLLNTDQ